MDLDPKDKSAIIYYTLTYPKLLKYGEKACVDGWEKVELVVYAHKYEKWKDELKRLLLDYRFSNASVSILPDPNDDDGSDDSDVYIETKRIIGWLKDFKKTGKSAYDKVGEEFYKFLQQ